MRTARPRRRAFSTKPQHTGKRDRMSSSGTSFTGFTLYSNFEGNAGCNSFATINMCDMLYLFNAASSHANSHPLTNIPGDTWAKFDILMYYLFIYLFIILFIYSSSFIAIYESTLFLILLLFIYLQKIITLFI